MRTGRRQRLGCAALALLAICAAVWAAWPRERLLLSRERRLTSAKGWSVDRGPDAATMYGWLSDHEVLFAQGASVAAVTLYRRDVQTGQQAPLTALTGCFHKTHGDVDGVATSPDGRWLAWYGGADSIICASLDGFRCSRYPWREDSYGEFSRVGTIGARWIETQTVRGSADGSGSLAHMFLHDESLFITITRMIAPLPYVHGTGVSETGIPRTVAIDTAAGVALLTAAQAIGLRREFPDTVNVLEFVLTPSRDAPRIFDLHVPSSGAIQNLCISPDGKRAAWLMNAETQAPLAQFIHRWIPAFPAPVAATRQLWVSNIETGKSEEIGHLRTSAGDPGALYLLDSNTLQWMPGCKRLSFVYGEDLYIVDAP